MWSIKHPLIMLFWERIFILFQLKNQIYRAALVCLKMCFSSSRIQCSNHRLFSETPLLFLQPNFSCRFLPFFFWAVSSGIFGPIGCIAVSFSKVPIDHEPCSSFRLGQIEIASSNMIESLSFGMIIRQVLVVDEKKSLPDWSRWVILH